MIFQKREDMLRWLYCQDDKAIINYCYESIKERVERKKLIYTPCQVEVRSCKTIPSIISYLRASHTNNYYQWCSNSFNLKKRFIDFDNLDFTNRKPIIQTDSREQLPLFNENINKLDFGDYKITIKKNIYFERKSLSDFIGTLSNGFNRFEREIQRANKNYLIIIIEALLDSCLHFNNQSVVFSKLRITPEYIFRHVRDLLQAYPNIQFLFVKNRDEMKRIMIKIANYKNDFTQIDWQLAYDLKLI